MKNRLMHLTVFALCLCALLLGGTALADSFNIRVADYAEVRKYCQAFGLFMDSEYFDNTSEIGLDTFLFPSARIGVRIVPNPECSVESIKCRDDAGTQSCTLTEKDGTVTAYFPYPASDMTVTITMTHPAAVSSKVEGQFQHCSGTLSDGTQTGTESIFAEEGSTVTVSAVPLDGYYIKSMAWTSLNDPVQKTIEFTKDGSGKATGSFTMPGEQVNVSVEAVQPAVPYMSYNAEGHALGSKDCTHYTVLTASNSEYYDLTGTYGGFYVVQGTVTMGEDTTIRVSGDVHLILCDGAVLNATDGIYIMQDSSLSIYGQSSGSGKLVAKPESGPGIGGMEDTVAGSLYIHGGQIEAQGGANAAGIGGGNHESGHGDIVIYGGKVTAQGGTSGAGIGKGQQNSPGSCGSIVIYGGTVEATGGKNAAGLGGGEDRDGGRIIINGGKVTAAGGQRGAGIGGGKGGTGGIITINGGSVHTTAGENGAGLGGGNGKNSGTITINGGTVEAYGNEINEYRQGGAAIGAGIKGDVDKIVINAGTVKAYTKYTNNAAAAIGSSGGDFNGTIEIHGGNVEATSHIGAGLGAGGDGTFKGTVLITGGTVSASSYAAGIGAGDEGNFKGTVRITDGNVTAESRVNGAGIGAGQEGFLGKGGECEGTIEITGGIVTAFCNSTKAQAIGHGEDGDKEGTLILGDFLKVRGGSVKNVANEIPEEVGKRTNPCREWYARIEPCEDAQGSYTLPEGEMAYSHTWHCRYCKAERTEVHAYDAASGADRCTLCGYAGESVIVTYLKGDDRAAGEMQSVAYVPGVPQIIAPCAYVLSGYEFAGWRVSDTEELLASETEYTFAAGTGALNLTAVWHSAWNDLQAAISGAEAGEVLTLQGHTTASDYDSALVVPSGKSITLDLNGYTLSRGRTAAVADGHVLTNNGTLTIMDSAGGGEISGGSTSNTSDGGGIINFGTLTLESGIISDNSANMAGAVLNKAGATFVMKGGSLYNNVCGTGGGGAVVNYGTMTMSGGNVSGNTSGANGGGLWNRGTLTVSGGTITGNTATYLGGGIYARGDGVFRLSGAPQITENSSEKNGDNNLHLGVDNNRFAPIQAENLEEGLKVGLSTSKLPTEEAPVDVISGVSGSIPGLVSDKAAYALLMKGGVPVLALSSAFGDPDFMLPGGLTAVEAEAFEGIAAAAVEIPEGVRSVGEQAFASCLKLRKIRIPSGCTLGADVFKDCTLVYVFGTPGSEAEAYCSDPQHGNCVFVPEE